MPTNERPSGTDQESRKIEHISSLQQGGQQPGGDVGVGTPRMVLGELIIRAWFVLGAFVEKSRKHDFTLD